MIYYGRAAFDVSCLKSSKFIVEDEEDYDGAADREDEQEEEGDEDRDDEGGLGREATPRKR